MHVAFDGRDAHLAIPLRGVRIATGEESAVAPDGQPERRPLLQMAGIDVPPALVRRQHVVDALLIGMRPHGSQKGLYRDLDSGSQLSPRSAFELEGLDERVREV